MSGLDGAVLDEFTQGINAPANGQQGYVVFADAQEPRPNLEYKSVDETAQRLRLSLGLAASVVTPEPHTIAANGSTVISTLLPNLPYCTCEFWLRAMCKVGTAVTWVARTRLVILTGAAGTITGSNVSAEYTVGSGFTLAPGASVSTISLTVNSTTASVVNVFASITETYRKQLVL